MESDSKKKKNRKETAGNILLNEIYSHDSQGDKETGHIMRFGTKYNLQGNSEGGGGKILLRGVSTLISNPVPFRKLF